MLETKRIVRSFFLDQQIIWYFRFRREEENGGFVHHVARVVRSERDPDAGYDLRQTTLLA